MKQVRIAIIGSGVAGLALAYFLAKRNAKKVLLLEQEEQLGRHASGQNAGMIRQVVAHEAIAPLAQQGAHFLRTLPPSWKVHYRANGSLLLAQGKEKNLLRHSAAFAQKFGLHLKWLSPRRAIQKVPVLEGAHFEEALFCPSDGVIDIHALLAGYARGAKKGGAEIWMNAKVKRIRSDASGNFQLESSWGKVQADILVNASGAWADPIAKMAGASAISFRSFRRHLLLSRPIAAVDPSWPFVWDMSHAIYFRPQEGGLLLSPCDQDLLPSGPCAVDALQARRRLLERLVYFPALPKINIRRAWGGLRTFAPDDNFCVGWDGDCKNFFWVAGLDGHGMTTSSAVGELASALLLGKKTDRRVTKNLSPSRFQTGLVEEGD